MRLAIVNLTAGGLSGGYRSYLRNLVPRLAADSSVTALRVLVPPTGAGDPGVQAWPEAVVRHPARWIRRNLDEFAPDVVFVPTARRFRFHSVPTVTMVRNMESLLRPVRGNPLPAALRNLARRELARRACRDAARVIAVSGFVRDFLVEHWRLPAEGVSVVPHGVSQDIPPDTLRPPPGLDGMTDDSWLFTAGSIRPARGLEDVLGAVALLNAGGRNLRLVIAGEADPATRRFAARLKRDARAMGIDEQVHWLGRVDAAEMGWCFRHSGAFVMTSRVEACPITVLEAMAHGALSISTDQPPMPEFFGGAAAYYPAADARALAERIDATLALGVADRARARDAARQRARAFTWDRTADATIAALRSVLT